MNPPSDPLNRTTVYAKSMSKEKTFFSCFSMLKIVYGHETHEIDPPPPPKKKKEWLFPAWVRGGGVYNCINISFLSLRPPCSEVLCLGIVTFEQGVAWLTGSYSMAVRPIEEHPCVLRGKGSQIKYATRWPRALLHAKPNISPISAKDKVWCQV